MGNKKKCFIITPIGNANEPIRRHIDGIIKAAIKPAIEDEFDIFVAHEMSKVGSITKQIIEEIFISDLVIANLTNKNPNVMYELALRHCLGKPVIQIMEEGTVLPFDIAPERTIEYTNDPQGILELQREIVEFVNEIDYNNTQQGPIYGFLHEYKYKQSLLKIKSACGYILINIRQRDVNQDLLYEIADEILKNFTYVTGVQCLSGSKLKLYLDDNITDVELYICEIHKLVQKYNLDTFRIDIDFT